MKIRSKEFLGNAILVCGSIMVAFLIGELSVRDYGDGFKNRIMEEGKNLVQSYFPGLYSYDPYLGWVPKPHISQVKWNNNQVSTIDDGIRSNGNPNPPVNRPLILAIGDSFTFGDQVSDHETWPSFLERMSGWTVLNAGVSSYGLDQIVLRAEQLVPKYQPDILIVSLIFDDLTRCHQRVRHGVPKPYFMIENKGLVLENVPIHFDPEQRLDWLRRILGYSHLIHKLMDRLCPEFWWKGTLRDYRYIKNDSLKISVQLLIRLEKLQRNNTRIVLLVQGDINTDQAQQLVFRYILKQLSAIPRFKSSAIFYSRKTGYYPSLFYNFRYCKFNEARDKKLEICNLVPYLVELKTRNPQEFDSFYIRPPGSHMTPRGNAWIARMVKNTILRQ